MTSHVQLDMIDQILQFHHKGNMILDKKFSMRVAPFSMALDQLQTLERSDFEITPFHDEDIHCDADSLSPILRKRSAYKFADQVVPFSKVKALLAHSFKKQKDGSRPYPAAGALYMIEVVCALFAEKLSAAPMSGFYHYRPSLNVLQPIKLADSNEIREVMFKQDNTGTQSPNVAFLYVMVLNKAVVKYRYRGYRYALMEAGAMFHQADLVGQSEGLINKIYSGFNDHEITKFIGLDRMNFLPMVIQSFGMST